jgi:monoamine oxidase
MFLRDEIVGTGDGLEEIVGGMDLLPTGLAKLIPQDRVLLNTEVRGIKWAGSSGTLHLRSRQAGDQAREAACVICALPFAVLRRLDVVGFGDAKLEAIRGLSYASSTKVLIHCKERFWEQKPYNIFGGASLSDQISRSTYYPSDNVPENHARPTVVASRARGITTAYSLVKSVGPAAEEIAHGPGVLLGSYSWGQDARRLGSVSAAERASIVQNKIARFHPEIDRAADDNASMCWDENMWAGGAFSFLAPHDQALYLEAAAKREGSFHFAGEHTSTDQAWIQGAAMSAIRCLEEILS